MKFKVKFYLDDDEIELGEIDIMDADKDAEKWWFEISLKNDLGCKPIKVNEG